MLYRHTISDKISSSFLRHLKSLYPVSQGTESATNALSNPWYIVAAVAFSASNKPESVTEVFEQAMQDMWDANSTPTDRHLLARKFRECLFKSGLISGYPRAINSLVSLHQVMPEELRDTTMHRNPHTSLIEYQKTGTNLFNSFYGGTAGSTQNVLNSIYPDMGWFSQTIGYGITYGYTDILSPIETSYTLVAALIAGDTPRQLRSHLDGARRVGASLEEVKAVREIAMEVATASGVSWRDGVPSVEDEVAK